MLNKGISMNLIEIIEIYRDFRSKKQNCSEIMTLHKNDVSPFRSIPLWPVLASPMVSQLLGCPGGWKLLKRLGSVVYNPNVSHYPFIGYKL